MRGVWTEASGTAEVNERRAERGNGCNPSLDVLVWVDKHLQLKTDMNMMNEKKWGKRGMRERGRWWARAEQDSRTRRCENSFTTRVSFSQVIQYLYLQTTVLYPEWIMKRFTLVWSKLFSDFFLEMLWIFNPQLWQKEPEYEWFASVLVSWIFVHVQYCSSKLLFV